MNPLTSAVMSAERAPGSPDRRSSKRKKAKGKVKVECRRGATGLGPNLALELLDVSQTGASLMVGPGLAIGDEVEIQISSTTMFRPLKLLGVVVRLGPQTANRFMAGVHFQKQIPYSDMNNLT